jgi:F-box protein 11
MFVRPGVDPVVRRNAIYGGGFAVLVGGGRGTFEDNDLNAVGRAGLCIAAGATTTARRNRIRQSAENGILVGTDSTATLEDNEIVSALGAGVLVTDGAHATARRNRVARSGLAAVEVDKGGGGLFEDNDLRDNAGGAFDIAAEAGPVECSGNLE